MTAKKPIEELRRPNRAYGELLRANVSCPLCRGRVKVVAYRHSTTRLECLQCQQRFSIKAGMLKPGTTREELEMYVLVGAMRHPAA